MDENAMNNFSTIFHGSAHFDGNFLTGTLSEILWKHVGPGFSIFNANFRIHTAYSTVVWKQRLYSTLDLRWNHNPRFPFSRAFLISRSESFAARSSTGGVVKI